MRLLTYLWNRMNATPRGKSAQLLRKQTFRSSEGREGKVKRRLLMMMLHSPRHNKPVATASRQRTPPTPFFNLLLILPLPMRNGHPAEQLPLPTLTVAWREHSGLAINWGSWRESKDGKLSPLLCSRFADSRVLIIFF